MSLENISPEEIVKIEIGTGDPILYSFSEENFLKENL
jgi:bisphosphoglycerate-dependent phosphoglycerate mutase